MAGKKTGKKKTFLRQLSHFLAYRPPHRETFVLPELKDEKSKRIAPEDIRVKDLAPSAGKQGGGGQEKDKQEKGKKKPIRAGEWHRVRAVRERGVEKGSAADRISPDVRTSLAVMKKEFNLPGNIDAVVREFKLARKTEAFIVFIDGMADRGVINDYILRQMMSPAHFEGFQGGCPFEHILDNVLSVNQAKKHNLYSQAVSQVLMGVTALFIEGCDSCLCIETRGFEKRGIEKPATEAVVRGPQEGFTENLKTSTTQIRRIIKNKDLINEIITIGTDNTMVSVLYVKGIVNPAVVAETKRRLKSIRTDFIGGDGMLEQLIEDRPWMIVPQVLTTERPDRTASHLMEGKVAVIVDGSPFAIIVPVTFLSLLQSPEDSFLRWQYGTALRLIRIISVFTAMLLPTLYIALVNYHQEMIPTDLLVAIARSRENVPFPAIIEVILMEVSFELIREAGIRVPGIIGTTLGIIGALILGQAAVAANIVSPILIIIVAVTGLSNFAIPNYSLAFGIRILRFNFIILGGLLGFFGIAAGLVMIAALAVSMKSFGVPFLAPGWPRAARSADLIVRYPTYTQEERPDQINPLNKRRQPEISRGWVKEDPPEGKRE